MLRIIISFIMLVTVSTGQASLHSVNVLKIDKTKGGYAHLAQPLRSKEFSQHVTHFCLNQVEGFGLDSRFMTAYVIECAADYGVFNIVLK